MASAAGDPRADRGAGQFADCRPALAPAAPDFGGLCVLKRLPPATGRGLVLGPVGLPALASEGQPGATGRRGPGRRQRWAVRNRAPPPPPTSRLGSAARARRTPFGSPEVSQAKACEMRGSGPLSVTRPKKAGASRRESRSHRGDGLGPRQPSDPLPAGPVESAVSTRPAGVWTTVTMASCPARAAGRLGSRPYCVSDAGR